MKSMVWSVSVGVLSLFVVAAEARAVPCDNDGTTTACLGKNTGDACGPAGSGRACAGMLTNATTGLRTCICPPVGAGVAFIRGEMSAAKETTPPISNGVGTCIAAVNDAGDLEYTGVYSNLTSNANNAHIHGPAPLGMNASVAVGASRFTPAPQGAFAGSGTLPAGPGPLTVTQMKTALSYCNVHTVNNGGGEIRGQLDTPQVPASRPVGLVLLSIGLLASGAYIYRRRRMTGVTPR